MNSAAYAMKKKKSKQSQCQKINLPDLRANTEPAQNKTSQTNDMNPALYAVHVKHWGIVLFRLQSILEKNITLAMQMF